MRFERGRRIATGLLDMTPLIDVVLLLLIFFMLSSSFVFQPGLKVELPEYTSTERVARTDVVVSITGEGLYLYNDNAVLPQELKSKFRQAVSENPKVRLIIKAANEVSHGAVVRVMIAAKEAGIENQAFATRPKEE
jgi:biopolymer transport protein ExbD